MSDQVPNDGSGSISTNNLNQDEIVEETEEPSSESKATESPVDNNSNKEEKEPEGSSA